MESNKINIAELLKDAPAGTKLWSNAFGDVTLKEIDFSSDSPIIVKTPHTIVDWIFYEDGTQTRGNNAECILWPSKDHRDWSDFKLPKAHTEFKPLQYVLVPHNGHWRLDQYSHYDKEINRHVLMSNITLNERVYPIIPYKDNKDLLGREITDEYRYKD